MKKVPVVFLLFVGLSMYGAEFTGNYMLAYLGKNVGSAEFGSFKAYWGLDARYENTAKGIKVVVNQQTKTVDSILVTGHDCKIAGLTFSTCKDALPFDIKMTDDAATVSRKTGAAATASGNVSRFDIKSCGIMANFYESNKVRWLKFFIIRSKNPTVIDRTVSAGKGGGGKGISPFKAAIMDVFDAWRNSALASVKSGVRQTANFWGYKHTYTTRVKIPGEMYNMVYCFPFEYSQMDFVSVLKESDTYDASFETLYKSFEKKLMDNFPASEGWKASCLPSHDNSKLSDFEVRNDRFGSIILDYSKNPKGKHVLYLRFLLYSN